MPTAISCRPIGRQGSTLTMRHASTASSGPRRRVALPTACDATGDHDGPLHSREFMRILSPAAAILTLTAMPVLAVDVATFDQACRSVGGDAAVCACKA